MVASVVDKTELSMVRCLEGWSDTITVSLVAPYPPGVNQLPIDDYIASWRVQLDDISKTVLRTPGPGYPSDCNAWESISLTYLNKPMTIAIDGSDNEFVEWETETIPGVTYPNMVGGPGVTTLTGTFSGAYTLICFPCNRMKYLDNGGYGEDGQTVIRSDVTADDNGLNDFLIGKCPKIYDHVTEYRPDPTQYITLTYTIYVYLVLDAIPVVETHTITQIVENNPSRHGDIISTLVKKQRPNIDIQNRDQWGVNRDGYNPFGVV